MVTHVSLPNLTWKMVECHYKWENFLLENHQKLFHSYWHMKVNKNFCNRAKIPIPDSCKRKVNILVNLHPLSDVGRNMVTKGEDEVLNVVFASLFNSKTSFLWVPSHPDLEDRDRSGMKPPQSQEQQSVTCCYLLVTTQTHTSLWGQVGSTQEY